MKFFETEEQYKQWLEGESPLQKAILRLLEFEGQGIDSWKDLIFCLTTMPRPVQGGASILELTRKHKPPDEEIT